ncbi:MAG: polyprenol monophosphomannose synthase [Bacteroidales bacterium]|nr:polyprenol monophosphomannose synthase [Bacteroidales bacterium]
MSNKVIIIPTYKEKENIENIIRVVFKLPEPFDILVIDDNSPDGTADIVKNIMAEYPDRLFMIQRSGKLGLGTAYITGFKWSLEHNYDYIFEMDADFSHPPEELINLYNACAIDKYDMSIGSRYISGVNVVNWPIGRVLMSYYGSAYVRTVTRMKIMDTTAGFVCYTKKVLQAINLDHIKMKGYGFQIEMKFTAWKKKFKIKEVPIIFTDRKQGTSKMSTNIFGEAVWGVLKMKIVSWFKKY